MAECEEGITASLQFFKDVVSTWLSVKRVLNELTKFVLNFNLEFYCTYKCTNEGH